MRLIHQSLRVELIWWTEEVDDEDESEDEEEDDKDAPIPVAVPIEINGVTAGTATKCSSVS